jgi:N-formylmaleamate deformylase
MIATHEADFVAEQSRFYVSVNDVKLHFLEYGSGSPVVLLLPGITSPAITWGFVAERIAEFARVLVLDNRGRGLSDQRPGLNYGLDDYAADAVGLLRELDVRDAVVLGHSMGARIGIRLTANHPERVAKLVLADPPVSGPGRRPYPSPLEQYLKRIDAASRGETVPPSTRPTPETPEQARLRVEWLPTCSREAVIASYQSFDEEDIFGDLPRITCPTLLLYAELGGTITDDEANEIVRLPGVATSRKLEGVGHMMPWYDLEQFIEAIRPFIAGSST